MKRILIILLFINIGAYAQTQEDFVTFDVLSPMYFNQEEATPRWRLGFVKSLDEKKKIGIDLGYGNSATSILNTGDNYRLFEIRLEYYHIIDPRKKTQKYFALELFYINHAQTINTDTYLSENNEFLRFDQADYKRQKFGLIPKFGMFIDLSDRFGLNLYTGTGIKYRINEYSNVINAELNNTFEEHFPPYFRNEGKKIGFEFSFGLKLLYRIKVD